MFIALEGCDGAGKSTIRNILKDIIESNNRVCFTVGQHSWLNPWDTYNIVNTRERRQIVEIPDISASYIKDKQLHGHFNVKPMINQGCVIADRWIYSDAAYHEALYGIPAEETLVAHCAMNTLLPDIVIYVELNVEEAYKRILKRGRHTKHYERPVDLKKICKAYERIFFNDKLAVGPKIVVFDNTAENVASKVKAFSAENVIPFITPG